MKTSTQTRRDEHAALLKKYHTLCSKLGMTAEQKDQVLLAYGVGSSTALTIDDLREINARLDTISKPRDMKADEWRKRLIAAIDGWLIALNHTPNIDLIKSIACRAAQQENFNKIPVDRLRSLYYAFSKKSKDLKYVDLVTATELRIQSHLN